MFFMLGDLCFRRRRMKNLMTNLMTTKDLHCVKALQTLVLQGHVSKMRGLQIIPIGEFHFRTKIKVPYANNMRGWKRSSSPVGSRLMQVGLFSFYFCFWNPDLFEQKRIDSIVLAVSLSLIGLPITNLGFLGDESWGSCGFMFFDMSNLSWQVLTTSHDRGPQKR